MIILYSRISTEIIQKVKSPIVLASLVLVLVMVLADLVLDLVLVLACPVLVNIIEKPVSFFLQSTYTVSRARCADALSC